MEQNLREGIVHLKECDLAAASEAGMSIVRISFDNDYDPIYLGSQELLADNNYITFVEDLLQIVNKNYRIDHWVRNNEA